MGKKLVEIIRRDSGALALQSNWVNVDATPIKDPIILYSKDTKLPKKLLRKACPDKANAYIIGKGCYLDASLNMGAPLSLRQDELESHTNFHIFPVQYYQIKKGVK